VASDQLAHGSAEQRSPRRNRRASHSAYGGTGKRTGPAGRGPAGLAGQAVRPPPVRAATRGAAAHTGTAGTTRDRRARARRRRPSTRRPRCRHDRAARSGETGDKRDCRHEAGSTLYSSARVARGCGPVGHPTAGAAARDIHLCADLAHPEGAGPTDSTTATQAAVRNRRCNPPGGTTARSSVFLGSPVRS
jgi:hypothetical protein